MKVKKFLLTAVAALGLATVTGFNHNVVKADTNVTSTQTAVPNKEEIIRKANLNQAKSGRIDSTMRFKTWEIKHHKVRPYFIRTEDTTIFSHHGKLIYAVIRSGKDKIRFWATPNTIYAKDSKKWQKWTLPKSLKSESPDRLEMSFAGLALRVYDAMQVSDNGSSYVLTLANNAKLNHELLEGLIKSTKMDKDMAYDFRQMKLNRYTLRAVYDKNSYQLLGANFQMGIHHNYITVKGTISNINAYNNLRIPRKVIKHAKKIK